MNHIQELKSDLKYYHNEYNVLENKYLNGELNFREFKFEVNATLTQIKILNDKLVKLNQAV